LAPGRLTDGGGAGRALGLFRGSGVTVNLVRVDPVHRQNQWLRRGRRARARDSLGERRGASGGLLTPTVQRRKTRVQTLSWPHAGGRGKGPAEKPLYLVLFRSAGGFCPPHIAGGAAFFYGQRGTGGREFLAGDRVIGPGTERGQGDILAERDFRHPPGGKAVCTEEGGTRWGGSPHAPEGSREIPGRWHPGHNIYRGGTSMFMGAWGAGTTKKEPGWARRAR